MADWVGWAARGRDEMGSKENAGGAIAATGYTLLACRCTSFQQIEALLDDNVGRLVWVTVSRGGEKLSFALRVTDLHHLSPSSLLEVTPAADISLSAAHFSPRSTIASPLSCADSRLYGLLVICNPNK